MVTLDLSGTDNYCEVRFPEDSYSRAFRYALDDGQLSRSDVVDFRAAEAVTVKNNQIVADPSKMIAGLGYPVVYQGRHWWVVKSEQGTLKYLRGNRA